MSGLVSAEDSALVRAGVIGAACGLALVAGVYAVVMAVADRISPGRGCGRSLSGTGR